MTGIPEFYLQPVDKWTNERVHSDTDDLRFKRSLVTGELADRVRARFEISEELPVYFVEYEEEYGACPTRYGTANMLRVECGDRTRSFSVDGVLPLNKLLDWFDEPRREAERAREKAAAGEAARLANRAFTRGIVDPLTDALGAVEAEGYQSDQEWHDKLMNKLGVRGY